MPYIVKKHEGTRVLVMHTDGERHPYVDANLDTGRSIEALVEKIAAMHTTANQITANQTTASQAARIRTKETVAR